MVKIFESSEREAGYGEYANTTPLEFVLPGDLHVYTGTPPKPAIWQRTVLSGRSRVSESRQIAALLDFLSGTLKDPSDRQRLEDRMLDPADSLDLVDVFPVVTWLSQTWSLQMQGKPVDIDSTPDEVPAEMPAAAPVEAVFEQPGEALADASSGETAVAVPSLPPVPPVG